MKEFFDKLLQWLKDVLPSVTVVGSWIYSYMLSKIRNEQRAHEKTKLDKELLENEIEVKEDNSSKSDADIILGAINEGSGIDPKGSDS